MNKTLLNYTNLFWILERSNMKTDKHLKIILGIDNSANFSLNSTLQKIINSCTFNLLSI